MTSRPAIVPRIETPFASQAAQEGPSERPETPPPAPEPARGTSLSTAPKGAVGPAWRGEDRDKMNLNPTTELKFKTVKAIDDLLTSIHEATRKKPPANIVHDVMLEVLLAHWPEVKERFSIS